MTTSVFQDWLVQFDRSMRLAGRKVILLVDNASSHSDNGIILTNTKLQFLPPNTTAHIQPMDAGIIQNFKAHYKKLLCRHFLSCIEDNQKQTLDIKCALAFVKRAWNSVTVQTIVNCWKHVNILPQDLPLSTLIQHPESADVISEDDEDDIPLARLIAKFPLSEGETAISESEFINIDACLETGEHLNDDAIINLANCDLRQSESVTICDTCSDEENEIKNVSKVQARSAMKDVISYLEQQSVETKHLDAAWSLLTVINFSSGKEIQKTIKDFFQ